MKSSLIVVFLLCIVGASPPAFTAVQGQPADVEPPHIAMVRGSADNADLLGDLLVITPEVPRGPRDVLQGYELEMASIAERLSMSLETVSNAVGTGQITREQGEYVSGELYQVSMMQFQLFSALHAMLEADMARTPAVRTDPTPSSTGDVLLVAMPFSSLQLSPSLVEYLGLTPTQVRSIQRLMDRERPTTEPLMHELRTISGELGASVQQRQNNENEGAAQRLAAKQALLLKQLMRANSRLQRKINDVLDPKQRKKLDSFKRMSEVTVGEGNEFRDLQ
jgi:Spy/CpxP family protein refolding chaperone